MVDAQLAATQAAIEAAIKSGALIHHRVALEEGEWEQRSLWLRPEVNDLVSTKKLDPDQRERVKAALRRFVIGGPFTVVKAGSPHGEASNLGDIKELQGPPPPFVELRFKPPKHQLRIFGRFIRKDGLILMSFGMKSRAGTTGMKPLLIPNERRRCDSFFSARSVKLEWVPNPIENSLSNATFV
jgi:hypothetical protein